MFGRTTPEFPAGKDFPHGGQQNDGFPPLEHEALDAFVLATAQFTFVRRMHDDRHR